MWPYLLDNIVNNEVEYSDEEDTNTNAAKITDTDADDDDEDANVNTNTHTKYTNEGKYTNYECVISNRAPQFTQPNKISPHGLVRGSSEKSDR